MSDRRYLPDVNTLIALTDPEHGSHPLALDWHREIGDSRLLLCTVTESGFVRLSANPLVGGREMSEAIRRLQRIATLPNCDFLPMEHSWLKLIEPFAPCLQGYRQVTDALLLGLAIHANARLVTFDRGLKSLAGSEHAANLLVLE